MRYVVFGTIQFRYSFLRYMSFSIHNIHFGTRSNSVHSEIHFDPYNFWYTVQFGTSNFGTFFNVKKLFVNSMLTSSDCVKYDVSVSEKHRPNKYTMSPKPTNIALT